MGIGPIDAIVAVDDGIEYQDPPAAACARRPREDRGPHVGARPDAQRADRGRGREAGLREVGAEGQGQPGAAEVVSYPASSGPGLVPNISVSILSFPFSFSIGIALVQNTFVS